MLFLKSTTLLAVSKHWFFHIFKLPFFSKALPNGTLYTILFKNMFGLRDCEAKCTLGKPIALLWLLFTLSIYLLPRKRVNEWRKSIPTGREQVNTYRIWSVVLLAKCITTSYHLDSRGCLNECWIYRCPWPWCWINWDKANHKIRVTLCNFYCCSCVVSRCKITSWAHFSKQQQAPTPRQTLHTVQRVLRISIGRILLRPYYGPATE